MASSMDAARTTQHHPCSIACQAGSDFAVEQWYPSGPWMPFCRQRRKATLWLPARLRKPAVEGTPATTNLYIAVFSSSTKRKALKAKRALPRSLLGRRLVRGAPWLPRQVGGWPAPGQASWSRQWPVGYRLSGRLRASSGIPRNTSGSPWTKHHERIPCFSACSLGEDLGRGQHLVMGQPMGSQKLHDGVNLGVDWGCGSHHSLHFLDNFAWHSGHGEWCRPKWRNRNWAVWGQSLHRREKLEVCTNPPSYSHGHEGRTRTAAFLKPKRSQLQWSAGYWLFLALFLLGGGYWLFLALFLLGPDSMWACKAATLARIWSTMTQRMLLYPQLWDGSCQEG